MPYSWQTDLPARPDAPTAVLTLWPHRSLSRGGFAAFILISYALLLIPILNLLGQPALWGILPFCLAALGLTWVMIERSYRDGALTETLTLWPDRVRLVRQAPKVAEKSWEARPYWVRVEMKAAGGPVENYLILKGGPRDVEIGAFLSPDERVTLRRELQDALSRAAHD